MAASACPIDHPWSTAQRRVIKQPLRHSVPVTHSLPYVPGPSTAPISPPAPASSQVQPPPAAQVVVGDPVDLAHELAEIRKLHYANLALGGFVLVVALLAAAFAGYTAWYVYHFVDALQRAFGD